MLVLNNSYELTATYLQVFLLWMFCSELVLSFACVYFVVTGHFMPVWGLSILRANLASTVKSAVGNVGLTLPRSPFAIALFLLPFTSHCSTQHIGFGDSGYVIKPPQPSSAIYGAPPFTEYLSKALLGLLKACSHVVYFDL